MFRDLKFRRTATRNKQEIRAIEDENGFLMKLRNKFDEITGFYTPLPTWDRPSLSNSSMAVYSQVQCILYHKKETAYSSWYSLAPKEISTMYNLLKGPCQRGYKNSHALLIYCKACLKLTERPPVDELTAVVKTWVSHSPHSEWAHLYNYMLHFPSGEHTGRLDVAKESIRNCSRLASEKTGPYRWRSGAEYFFGKEKGLNAFVNASEMPYRSKENETKTDYWRRREVFEKLERLCGEKENQGTIAYKGIRVLYDDKLYPKRSRDKLWFYLGFNVAGPYAFDPMDNESYDALQKSMHSLKPPPESCCSSTNTNTRPVSTVRGRGRPKGSFSRRAHSS